MKKLLGLALVGATAILSTGCFEGNTPDTNEPEEEIPFVKEGHGLTYNFDFNNVKQTNFKYVIDGSISASNIDGDVKYFKTVQGFLTYAATATGELKVLVKNGTYKEKLVITTPNIIMIGESATGTIITYDDASDTPKVGGGTVGTSGSASVDIKASAEGFTAMNLTFENGFDEENSNYSNKQAVALKNNADKSLFYNVRFIGNQDTLYPDLGRQYFYKCYIEGDVDFIFGGANIIIDDSIVHSVDRNTQPKGYVTAARTNHDITDDALKSPYGFVFMNSKLTHNVSLAGISERYKVFLGRPWRQDAKVVYLDSEFGNHISAYRWTDMSGNTASKAFFREYNISGPGALVGEHDGEMLNKSEYENYTIENIFASIPRFTKEFKVYDTIDAIINSIK